MECNLKQEQECSIVIQGKVQSMGSSVCKFDTGEVR